MSVLHTRADNPLPLWASADPATKRDDDSIDAAFAQFHAANPRVYELFTTYARQVKAAGHAHYSADAILHRIRWHIAIETVSDDGWKINNNFSSRYARTLMADLPGEFAGFFELRVLKTRGEAA